MPTKTKIPTAKLDAELEKQYKEMEDISITKAMPKEPTEEQKSK